jgi:hypothetical protein
VRNEQKWLVSMRLWPFSLRIKRYSPQMYVFDTHSLKLMCEEPIKLDVTLSDDEKSLILNSYMTYGFGQGSKILGG